MVLKADQQRIKDLLKETITLLCKNGLSYSSEFCVEALIGITLDKDDVFLLSINETITSETCLDKGDERPSVESLAGSPRDHTSHWNKGAPKAKRRRTSLQAEVDNDERSSIGKSCQNIMADIDLARTVEQLRGGGLPAPLTLESAGSGNQTSMKTESSFSIPSGLDPNVVIKQEPNTETWCNLSPLPSSNTQPFRSPSTSYQSTHSGPLPEILTAFGSAVRSRGLFGSPLGTPSASHTETTHGDKVLPCPDNGAVDTNVSVAVSTPDSSGAPAMTSSQFTDVQQVGVGEAGLLLHRPLAMYPQDTFAESPKVKATSYTCSICARTFSSITGYRDHMRQHSGRYRYFCKECNKGFMQTSHYEGHMNKHQNRKPYECHMCSRTFVQRFLLRQHMRSVHGREKIPMTTGDRSPAS